MVSDNLHCLEEKISSICNRLGRKREDIILVGVTKYAQVNDINQAIEAGLKHIGENKTQEAIAKFEQIENVSTVTKHMIGHLQSNKAKQAVEHFDMIQSVDSSKLVREIQKSAEKLNKQIDILIQVNIAGEEQKFGVAPNNVSALIEEVIGLNSIRLRGLMTMAPFTEDEDIIRRTFAGLRELLSEMDEAHGQEAGVDMKYLSMGMTQDYEIALEEGSNMLRIGSAIFQ